MEAAQAKLEDSNVAGIGSDEDKALRLAAAQTEQEYKGAGQKEGIEIWRVEKLAIKRWPREDYGQFFQGDCYIVLRTYKDPESHALRWNVHFWLGQDCTQDERGVAAYKTVELDDLLGTAPVQYREVQGHESEAFLAIFKPTIHIMQGGIETGFNHVEPERYEPRLLQCRGKKHVRVLQVPLKRESLNRGDVFILDAGLRLFQWNAPDSSGFERRKAAEIVNSIKSERQGRPALTVLDGDEDNDDFWALLGGKGPITESKSEDDDEKLAAGWKNKLFRVSDASGNLDFKQEAEGELNRAMLDHHDAFVLDIGHQVFVWIGRDASRNERAKAIQCAETYLQRNNRPSHIPVTRILDGGAEPDLFRHALH